MEKFILICFFITICNIVSAEPYLDLSIMVHEKGASDYYKGPVDESKFGALEKVRNPIGMVEFGYQFENFENTKIFLFHISSTDQEDRGISALGVKYTIRPKR